MPKTNRSGQALALSSDQLDAIMNKLPPNVRGVLSMCRFTAARISEALSLKWENITSTDIVIPKAITKKKMRTRTIPMNPKLWEEIVTWKAAWPKAFKRESEKHDFLFPGHKSFDDHMTRRNVDYTLRNVCKKLGIEGASTHSFRRSALTTASDKGVPLRVLQSISGHSSLEMLQKYLDVKDEAKKQAALAFGLSVTFLKGSVGFALSVTFFG